MSREIVEVHADQQPIASYTSKSRSDTLVTLASEVSSVKTELVTNLKHQATKILADLHASKEPVLITEHGKPSAYLVDVEDFEFTQRRLAILEQISRGERAALEDRTLTNQQAKVICLLKQSLYVSTRPHTFNDMRSPDRTEKEQWLAYKTVARFS